MADYVHVICFRCSEEMRTELLRLADHNHRKLSDLVRLLLELVLEKNRGKI